MNDLVNFFKIPFGGHISQKQSDQTVADQGSDEKEQGGFLHGEDLFLGNQGGKGGVEIVVFPDFQEIALAI